MSYRRRLYLRRWRWKRSRRWHHYWSRLLRQLSRRRIWLGR
jgi:hypothetical protein